MKNKISILEFENLLKSYVILKNPDVRNVNISYMNVTRGYFEDMRETIAVINGKMDIIVNGTKKSISFSKEIYDLNNVLSSMLGYSVEHARINSVTTDIYESIYECESVIFDSDVVKLVL